MKLNALLNNLKKLCQQNDLQKIRMLQHQFLEVSYINKLRAKVTNQIK